VQIDEVPSLPVLGTFQRTNAVTAIAVLKQLDETLRPKPRRDPAKLFPSFPIQDEMELVPAKPPVVFDMAHNAEKAESLVASLRESFAGCRVHYVVAIGEPKDARRILESWRHCPPPSLLRRTLRPAAAQLRRRDCRRSPNRSDGGDVAIADPVEALTVARRLAAMDDVVVVTGSTFVVGELREWSIPATV